VTPQQNVLHLWRHSILKVLKMCTIDKITDVVCLCLWFFRFLVHMYVCVSRLKTNTRSLYVTEVRIRWNFYTSAFRTWGKSLFLYHTISQAVRSLLRSQFEKLWSRVGQPCLGSVTGSPDHNINLSVEYGPWCVEVFSFILLSFFRASFPENGSSQQRRDESGRWPEIRPNEGMFNM
jgi:hypothetical protein